MTGGAERRRQQKRKVEQLNTYGGTEQRDATDGVGRTCFYDVIEFFFFIVIINIRQYWMYPMLRYVADA